MVRGSCVNSVFSLTVNDNSPLPVSSSAQEDRNSLLLSSPNYLAVIQITKFKSRSSVKVLCWVKREEDQCLFPCLSTHLHGWTPVWAWTECSQDTITPPARPRFQESFNVRAGEVDLNQVHHKQTQGQIYVPLLTAFRCVQKKKIYPDIDLDEQSWGREIGLCTAPVSQGNLDHSYGPHVLINMLWDFSISPGSHLGALANFFQNPKRLCWPRWNGAMAQFI